MSARDAPPPSKRLKRPQLSAEDKALWDHVAGTVRKSSRTKPRVPEISANGQSSELDEALMRLEQRLKNESSLAETPISTRDRKPAEPPKRPALPHPTRQKVPPLSDFDRKAVRRIRSGRIEIEARIDLHGMRQDEAHRALRSFVGGCHGRGLRWVLVITGKGRAQQANGEDASFYIGEERGVLRRSVPRWLADADLRSMIVSYTTAALHHGGEGALYIQLRVSNSRHHS